MTWGQRSAVLDYSHMVGLSNRAIHISTLAIVAVLFSSVAVSGSYKWDQHLVEITRPFFKPFLQHLQSVILFIFQ